jgi:glucosamine--fructose-6-phosphate aminotransferase (isomerizing)
MSRDLIAVVHNGIIENYEELRTQLTKQGYEFTSDTDTEVIAHLIHSYYSKGKTLLAATQAALVQLVGAYAIGVVAADNPQQLIGSRKGSPLLLGVGESEHFIASDMSALLQVTQKVVYLEEGDIVELEQASYRVFDSAGAEVTRPVNISELNNASVELGEYQHYMQKEIHEQPQALADTLESVCNSKTLIPGLFGAEAANAFSKIDSILILACGTSHHAGMVARYWL